MIVRVDYSLGVRFGRVDEDGEIVNKTLIEFPIGKLCQEEFERVSAAVKAKHDEITHAVTALLAMEETPTEPEREVIEDKVLDLVEEGVIDASHADSL